MTQKPLKIRVHRADWPAVEAYYHGYGTIELEHDDRVRWRMQGRWDEPATGYDRYAELDE